MSDSDDSSILGEILLNKFEVIEKLGEGAFSKVYEVNDMIPKKKFACKIRKY